jgi:hypothetical protein
VGYVNATIDTHKLRGEVGRGFTVYTNDPASPRMFLTIKARILASVRLFPGEQARLDNRRPNLDTSRILVRKELTESGALKISDLRSSADWLIVSARRLEGKEALQGLPEPWYGDWLIELGVTDQPRYGHSNQTIRFTTGLTREPEVEIPVMVNLSPPVNVSVESLELQAAGGVPHTETLLISVRRGLDPSLLAVEAEPSLIGVELEPAGGRRFKLHVTWSGGEEREGSIRFRLGSESYRLPVALKRNASSQTSR